MPVRRPRVQSWSNRRRRRRRSFGAARSLSELQARLDEVNRLRRRLVVEWRGAYRSIGALSGRAAERASILSSSLSSITRSAQALSRLAGDLDFSGELQSVRSYTRSILSQVRRLESSINFRASARRLDDVTKGLNVARAGFRTLGGIVQAFADNLHEQIDRTQRILRSLADKLRESLATALVAHVEGYARANPPTIPAIRGSDNPVVVGLKIPSARVRGIRIRGLIRFFAGPLLFSDNRGITSLRNAVPVRTGRLARSIGARYDGLSKITVGTRVEYADNITLYTYGGQNLEDLLRAWGAIDGKRIVNDAKRKAIRTARHIGRI